MRTNFGTINYFNDFKYFQLGLEIKSGRTTSKGKANYLSLEKHFLKVEKCFPNLAVWQLLIYGGPLLIHMHR